jgi:hypothetical protein
MRARVDRLIAGVGLAVLAVAALLWLAGCGSGTVSGTVIEKSQRTPVRNATVTLGDQRVLTGADGAFVFEDVASGHFEMSVTAKGFGSMSRDLVADGGTTQSVVEITRDVPATVRLIAPAAGDRVAGGSLVHVAAVTSGFAGGVTLRLVVDGSVIGRAQTGTSCSFPWNAPKNAKDCVLRVVATTADGVVVRSENVRVKVKYAAPASATGDLPVADSAGGHWWGAFYYASKSLSEAQNQSARGSSAGYSTYVLNTLDYANLGKPGEEWWVVCAGKYGTYADAQAAAAMLRADSFSGAYAKEVY